MRCPPWLLSFGLAGLALAAPVAWCQDGAGEPLSALERAEEMRRLDVMPGGREVLENAAQVKREKFERMPMMIALAAGGALLFWIASTVFIRLATAGHSPRPARQHKIDLSAFEDNKQDPTP